MEEGKPDAPDGAGDANVEDDTTCRVNNIDIASLDRRGGADGGDGSTFMYGKGLRRV